MHPRHQIEVFADGGRAIPAHSADQLRAEYPKCSGNDHQHVGVRPSFSSDQERAQVFHHLNDLDAFPREAYPPNMPFFDFRAVQDAHDPAHAHNALRVSQHRDHDPQEGIPFQNRIGIHDAHIRRGRRVQPGVDRVRLASPRILVHHQKPRVGFTPIECFYLGGRHLRNIDHSDRTQSEFPI